MTYSALRWAAQGACARGVPVQEVCAPVFSLDETQ